MPEVDMKSAEFKAKVDEYLKNEEHAFQTWMQTSDFDCLIDRALGAGLEAYVDRLSTADNRDRAVPFACIDLAHRRAKPLVIALQKRQVGYLDHKILNYLIFANAIVDHLDEHFAAQYAAIEAFALHLSKPGFELAIRTRDPQG